MTPLEIKRIAERLRNEDERERRTLLRLHRAARGELQRCVEIARSFPAVHRIWTWGSIQYPERFREYSDIDICIAGVDDPVTWGEIERRLLEIVTFRLDLVKWESLLDVDRRSIEHHGALLYESD